jgi:hypothetical protein
VTPVSPPSDRDVTINGDNGVTALVTPGSPKYGNLNREDSGKGNFLTAADAAPTPAGVLFGKCRRYLESTAGKTPDQARQIVGGWRKSYSDGDIIDAISRAQRQEAQDPVAFVNGCLQHGRRRPRVGAMSAIAAIEGVDI